MSARARVYVLTWVAYASYYLCRKQLAVVKSTLVDTLHVSVGALAAIDTGYLIAYAAGQFASGLVVDRVGPRRLVGAGMVAAAAVTALFGAASTSALFAVAFAANGLFQSTGWPGTIKAMTAWCPPASRGRVMGRWSTCYQIGGLAATALAARLAAAWGWRAAFYLPAAWTAAVGVIVWRYLQESPYAAAQQNDLHLAAPPPAKKSTIVLFREPLVWSLGAAYFCLKLIRYSLLFWLPFYLHQHLGYPADRAGYVSIGFEAGGTVGAIVVGALSDRVAQRRGVLVVVMVLGLAAALRLYGAVAPAGVLGNFAGLALVGFLLFGPDALVSSVAAQDLGGTDGAGTAAGAINGLGSIGAIAQGALVAGVAARWGWSGVFNALLGFAAVCAVALIPYALRGAARLEAPR